MARKNKITEAFEELEDEDELDAGSDADEDAADAEADEDFADEELTDEDVETEVQRLDEEARTAIQRTRQAGRNKRGRRDNSRTARAGRESRETERETVVWQETSCLDAPPPRPGMEQRWIRVNVGQQADPRNVSRKRREKWVPRAVDTVPEGFAPPTIQHGSLGSVISVLDLVLCERPLEWGQARRKHFARKSAMQRDAATHRHTDKAAKFGGPGVQKRVKRDAPTVGYGRRGQVQED